MPTNPLWLEHTERAAWDTVKTLREQLEKERKHLERLTQLHPAWPRIVALLDQAKQQFGITSENYEEVVLQLCAIGKETAEQRQQLKLELEHQLREAERQRLLGQALPSLSSTKINLSAPVRWFARLLERKRSLQVERGQVRNARGLEHKDVRRLLLALELRVEELSQAPRRELLELAVEIGHLALLLARAVRTRQRTGTE